MERIVHESKFSVARFDDRLKLYTLTYLPETSQMRDEEWKSLMTELYHVTDTLKPVYILDDNRERLYNYPPEIQEWTLKLFLEMWYRNGLKKYVQVLPKDFIGSLSAEQIVEMAHIKFTDVFENKIVATMDDAKKWLGIF
jgi:hypothetical protein